LSDTENRRFSCLPYGHQSIDESDVAAVTAVLRGDYLTGGPLVKTFEEKLAERVGAKYAVVCSSGTAALHLVATALGLRAGEHAIVPTMTFLATANAVRFTGAEVGFADVDPSNGLLGVDEIEEVQHKAGGKGFKAVFPVHLNGQCMDISSVYEYAKSQGMMVIEDACHALGTTYMGLDGERISVGSCQHSDACVFSFHPVKTITTGEGGAITTNDKRLYHAMHVLRNHGIIRDATQFVDKQGSTDPSGRINPWYYEMHELGFNYRASDIHCALGISQLDRLDAFVAARRRLAGKYDLYLGKYGDVIRPISKVAGVDAAWHLYVTMVDFETAGISRAHLMTALRESGVGSQVHYIPVHRQPYYRRRYSEQSLPGAELYYERALTLPLFPGMDEVDVCRVVNIIEALSAGRAGRGRVI